MWDIVSKHITSLGIPCSVQTLVEFQEWFLAFSSKPVIPRLYPIGKSGYQTGPKDPRQISFTDFSQTLRGGFGTLYSCLRTHRGRPDSQQVFLKHVDEDSGQHIQIEALLQEVSRTILSFYGFSRAVPRVLDIYQHPEFGPCFTMEQQIDALPFSDYLKTHLEWGTPSLKNDHLVLSVLSQLALYLSILEYELLLNHRDLTGTNVLMIAPSDSQTTHVSMGPYSWSITANHKVILIDFGFAAIGSLPSRKVLVQAGRYFKTSDPCPKEGRDLFLFLASLWKNASLRASVTYRVQSLISSWLTQGTKNWASWLETSSTDMKGMYLLTMKDTFHNHKTTPLAILQDIAREAPEIVAFHGKRPGTPVPSM